MIGLLALATLTAVQSVKVELTFILGTEQDFNSYEAAFTPIVEDLSDLADVNVLFEWRHPSDLTTEAPGSGGIASASFLQRVSGLDELHKHHLEIHGSPEGLEDLVHDHRSIQDHRSPIRSRTPIQSRTPTNDSPPDVTISVWLVDPRTDSCSESDKPLNPNQPPILTFPHTHAVVSIVRTSDYDHMNKLCSEDIKYWKSVYATPEYESALVVMNAKINMLEELKDKLHKLVRKFRDDLIVSDIIGHTVSMEVGNLESLNTKRPPESHPDGDLDTLPPLDGAHPDGGIDTLPPLPPQVSTQAQVSMQVSEPSRLPEPSTKPAKQTQPFSLPMPSPVPLGKETLPKVAASGTAPSTTRAPKAQTTAGKVHFPFFPWQVQGSSTPVVLSTAAAPTSAAMTTKSTKPIGMDRLSNGTVTGAVAGASAGAAALLTLVGFVASRRAGRFQDDDSALDENEYEGEEDVISGLRSTDEEHLV